MNYGENETGEETNSLPLLNMRDDDDWLLFGLYNEPLRIRNVMNHQLWQDIHTPYYIDEEEDAMAGIKTQYIELAVNNEYMGIYALCEQMDRKQLQLKKYKHIPLEVNYIKALAGELPPYVKRSCL